MQWRHTGFRKSKILSLHRENVDLEARELRLADSKTDPRAVPLSPPAVRMLAELPRLPGGSVSSRHLFPSSVE